MHLVLQVKTKQPLDSIMLLLLLLVVFTGIAAVDFVAPPIMMPLMAMTFY